MTISRDEWLRQRRETIGASDWPRILLGSFGGPHAVWREKLGLDVPTDMTEGQELGLRLEWTIVDLAIEKLKWGRPRQRRFQVVKRNGIFSATLDAVLYYSPSDVRVIECKAPGRVGEEAKDEWRFQSQAQMYASGIRRHAVAALGGGWGGLALRCWEQEYDAELVELVLPQLEAFWALVQSKTPPAWDGTESADATLKAAFPATGGAREPTEAELELLRQYAEARKAEAEAKRLRQEVQAALGSDTALVGWCTWKEQQGRTTVDTAALKEKHPEVYAEVAKRGDPVRVFRWKGEGP